MPRLFYIVTHPMTADRLLEGQLRFMCEKQFEVFLVTSPSKELDSIGKREGVRIIPVRMEREIHLVKDFSAFLQLYRIIKKFHPDIVNAGTPKAGLLGMMAAWLARVPVRIYVLRGLRLETKTGLTRLILKMTERTASACCTRVIAVSNSLRNKYLSLRLCKESKIVVLGHGSSNGIKIGQQPADGAAMRAKLKIPLKSFVIGFVGRLVRDKGITELTDAFQEIVSRYSDAHLLLIGDFEKGDPLSEDFIEWIRNNPKITFTGFVDNPAPFYSAMDLLAFPSYREGFPNAPLEAAVAAIPVVGFQATGTVDAIEDGRTGILVSPNSKALAAGICRYLDDPVLRNAHGKEAQNRVKKYFRQEVIWERMYQEYVHLLNTAHPSRFGMLAKRMLDLCVAFFGLLFLAPLLLLIAASLRLTIGFPVLFRQTRPGKDGKPFQLYKFRTMLERRDQDGALLPDKDRIFPFGNFLRSTSLDELPELLNVLKGEMSLVGPRPLLMQYLARYNAEQARRMEVKPGITGWAQINGRNELAWDKKLKLDVWYVDNQTFWLDLKILWLTFFKILKREGISAEGHATMPEFMGTVPSPEQRKNN